MVVFGEIWCPAPLLFEMRQKGVFPGIGFVRLGVFFIGGSIIARSCFEARFCWRGCLFDLIGALLPVRFDPEHFRMGFQNCLEARKGQTIAGGVGDVISLRYIFQDACTPKRQYQEPAHVLRPFRSRWQSRN